MFWYRAGHSNADPIYAVPFQYVGMTEYWGDSQESNGPVTTDKIQTVFLSDTQTVTEILVQQGDEVKKGDLLMAFDTTLSDLQLERKRLEVEKLKLQLEDEKAQLRNLNGMKPPALISNLGAFLANSASTLAGAVASSVEIANALGPSRTSLKDSNSVPSTARLTKVFLYTL